MQTTQQLAALKAMGIAVWRDRFADQTEPLAFHCLALGAHATILADMNPAMAIEEQNLVQAIAKALGADVSAVADSWNPENTLDHYQTIIAMGEHIIKHLRKKPQTGNIIATHAPAQLLMTPTLKSETWQLIRHLKI
jgi:hypothetical protein